MLKKILFLANVFLACLTAARGQRVDTNLGISSGLPNVYLLSICQDSDQSIWAASEQGLYRFDGQRFVNYNKYNSGLSSNELDCLCLNPADPDHLWIATQRDGVCYYDRKTGKISRLDQKILLSPDIPSITSARDGGMWITHYHFGPQYYNHLTGETRRYNFETIAGMPRQCWVTVEGNDGRLYVGHVGEGFSVVDTLSHTCVTYRYEEGNPHSLPGRTVCSISVDKGGKVWLGTEAGAALFDPATGILTPFVHNESNPHSIAPGRVWSICTLDNGQVWFGTTQGGVSILDTQSFLYDGLSKARFTSLPVNGRPGGTSTAYIRNVFQDSFGNVWLANYRGGIDVVSHLAPPFDRVDYISKETPRLSYKPAWSCACGHDGEVWFGAENEIVRYKDGGLTRIPIPSLPHYSVTYVRAMTVDRYGRVWVGTSEYGGYIYSPATGGYTRLENLSADVRSFYEDTEGRMWIGCDSGVYLCGGDRPTRMDSINSQLGDLMVHDICQDNGGNLWIGTFGKGVYVFSPDYKLLAHHQVADGFPSNAINSIYKDSKGRMWVGTREGAVVFLPSDTKRYRRISAVENRHINHVTTVEEDFLGNLWLGTDMGLLRIDSSICHISFYAGSADVPLGSFFENASVAAASGDLYFGSANGIFRVNPRNLAIELKPQPVKVTNFIVLKASDNRTENEMAVHLDSDRVTLPYNQNTFKITFDVMDYAVAQRTDFAYNMKGLDEVWVEGGDGNNPTFRNLPPGSYTFQVKQRIKGQEWGEPASVLKIRVEPPFWLTWWAKTAYALAAVGLLYLFGTLYKRRMELKQKLDAEVKNHELNEERLRFYTNVTHELRTPLTLITGPLEDMVGDPELPAKYSYKLQVIRDSSATLLNLINGILDFRKTETQNRQLVVKSGNLGNLVREIGLRYKELNRNEEVRFVIDIGDDTTPVYYDPEMMTTIVNNLMSNAVKYTTKGRITLSYSIVEKDDVRYCVIKVTDTGYGISKEAQAHIFQRYYQVHGKHQASGTGIGLALVKNLVDLHQGTISVVSEEGAGSTFTVKLLADNRYPDALHAESETPTKEESPKAPAEMMETKDRLTILVVEDNGDIREYIRHTLSAEYTVLTAANGLEGLKKVQEEAPDIVISDIMMPEMDGITMCRSIKDDVLTSHIPVILLTAKDSFQDKEEGYESGADSYLTKPFSAKLLISRINNIIRIRRRIAEKLMAAQVTPENTVEGTLCAEQESMQREEAAKALNPLDRQFLAKVDEIINGNLEREDLGAAMLSDKMCMSVSTLYRKIMALTGVSTIDYIRHLRMLKAAELLRDERTIAITDVAYKVGFGSPSSFAKAFKKAYGMSASEYVSQQNNQYQHNEK